MNSFIRTRRFRYGSMSVAITALLIAAVILANVIVTALANKYLWYVDMTKESMFTVSDPCFELLDETFKTLAAREESEQTAPAHVTIKFCDAYDNLMGASYSKYVLTTALELQEKFPEHIKVHRVRSCSSGRCHTFVIALAGANGALSSWKAAAS